LRRYQVIAIDGPAGSGKSTIAKLLAERIGFVYVNTGAMYRAVALVYKRGKGNPVKIAWELNIRFKGEKIFLGDEEITNKIYTPLVSKLSSDLSAISGVRKALVQKQRELALSFPIIMEGRDIGTVVFPDAEAKFFLTASLEERAMRRKLQLSDPRPIEEIEKEIEIRDRQDSTREDSPLKPADDAAIIDTTGIDIEGVLAFILRELKNKGII